MSVYWKPTLQWYIDKVRIMNAIQMEVKGYAPLNTTVATTWLIIPT